MAKNEVQIHIDDKQISDMKRNIHQQFLKVIAEMDKIKKEMLRFNNRLGEISRSVEEIKDRIVEDNSFLSCLDVDENDEK